MAFAGGAAISRSLVVEEKAEEVTNQANSEQGLLAAAVELVKKPKPCCFFLFVSVDSFLFFSDS